MAEPRFAIERSDGAFYLGTADSKPLFGAGHKATFLDEATAAQRLPYVRRHGQGFSFKVVLARSSRDHRPKGRGFPGGVR